MSWQMIKMANLHEDHAEVLQMIEKQCKNQLLKLCASASLNEIYNRLFPQEVFCGNERV